MLTDEEIYAAAKKAGAVCEIKHATITAGDGIVFAPEELTTFARAIAEEAAAEATQAEKQRCAAVCDDEARISEEAARKHPEGSDSRDRCNAAVRAAINCAKGIRSGEVVEGGWRADRTIEVLRAQLAQERARLDRGIEILCGIHALLYPAPVNTPDGRTMVFRPAEPDPHVTLQALSDRIRAIPDQLEAAAIRKRGEPPLCMCKDRPASACPGEWEPGCDLGNNPAYARPYDGKRG